MEVWLFFLVRRVELFVQHSKQFEVMYWLFVQYGKFNEVMYWIHGLNFVCEKVLSFCGSVVWVLLGYTQFLLNSPQIRMSTWMRSRTKGVMSRQHGV